MGGKYDFEERLVRFAGDMILFTQALPKERASTYFSDQLIRSSCGAALNYGEAQGAESLKDGVHKTAIVLKELKEEIKR